MGQARLSRLDPFNRTSLCHRSTRLTSLPYPRRNRLSIPRFFASNRRRFVDRSSVYFILFTFFFKSRIRLASHRHSLPKRPVSTVFFARFRFAYGRRRSEHSSAAARDSNATQLSHLVRPPIFSPRHSFTGCPLQKRGSRFAHLSLFSSRQNRCLFFKLVFFVRFPFARFCVPRR